MWQYRLFSRNGRYYPRFSGRMLFLTDPPVRGPVVIDPRKVLVCGSNTCIRCLGEDPEAVLKEMAVANGVSDPEIVGCRTDGTFWNNFWGCGNFIENRERRAPAVVIASGLLRSYDGNGGSTDDVWPEIERKCAQWNIPLVRMFPEGKPRRRRL